MRSGGAPWGPLKESGAAAGLRGGSRRPDRGRRGSVSSRTTRVGVAAWGRSASQAAWRCLAGGSSPPADSCGGTASPTGDGGCALPRSMYPSGRIPFRGSPFRLATSRSSVLTWSGSSRHQCVPYSSRRRPGGVGSSPSGWPGSVPVRLKRAPRGRVEELPSVAAGSVTSGGLPSGSRRSVGNGVFHPGPLPRSFPGAERVTAASLSST